MDSATFLHFSGNRFIASQSERYFDKLMMAHMQELVGLAQQARLPESTAPPRVWVRARAIHPWKCSPPCVNAWGCTRVSIFTDSWMWPRSLWFP